MDDFLACPGCEDIRVRAVLEPHKCVRLGSTRLVVEIERLFTAAIEEQVGLNNSFFLVLIIFNVVFYAVTNEMRCSEQA
jgi:hypothetical protein